MDTTWCGLNNYISETARSKGAVLVGYTKIRRSEPVIIYGFEYSNMWFFKRPVILTKRLGDVYKMSRDVQKSVSKELKKLGYTTHDKTILSVYGDFRPLAVSAGLGEWGKNGLVVNKKFGSGLLFAATFTDGPLEAFVNKGNIIESSCSDCGECIRACPANAFKDNTFSTAKCMAKAVKGCAECLKACKNK